VDLPYEGTYGALREVPRVVDRGRKTKRRGTKGYTLR